MMIKGAKLAGAVGALAPIDFLVSKSRIYCKFLTSKSRSFEKSGKVSTAPTLFRPDWRPCLDDDVSTDKPEKYLSYCCLKIPIYIAG